MTINELQKLLNHSLSKVNGDTEVMLDLAPTQTKLCSIKAAQVYHDECDFPGNVFVLVVKDEN